MTCFLETVWNGVQRALRYVISRLVGVSEVFPNQQQRKEWPSQLLLYSCCHSCNACVTQQLHSKTFKQMFCYVLSGLNVPQVKRAHSGWTQKKQQRYNEIQPNIPVSLWCPSLVGTVSERCFCAFYHKRKSQKISWVKTSVSAKGITSCRTIVSDWIALHKGGFCCIHSLHGSQWQLHHVISVVFLPLSGPASSNRSCHFIPRHSLPDQQ